MVGKQTGSIIAAQRLASMGKQKKRTEKPGRVVEEIEVREEITFEQFERTMKTIIRSKQPKSKPSTTKKKKNEGSSQRSL